MCKQSSVKLAKRVLRIAPDKIGFFKFILEGYDGLALLSTRDVSIGEVELFYPEELHGDVCGLVESLTCSLSLIEQCSS